MVSCFFYDTFAANKNIIMGRGDIKTKKGKQFAGSFGKSRPSKTKTAAPKKAAVKKEK